MSKTLEQLIAEQTPEVVAKAQTLVQEMLLNIHLAELRERVQKKRRTKWRRSWGLSSPPWP